jgi:hypothetical protein
MFRKNKKLNCEFGASAVEYIYGEMGEQRLAVFESHLPGCDGCIAELAEVSEARFKVYEWRRSAFEPLTTPIIRIPYNEPAAALGVIDRVWGAMSGSRVWAAGGFAACMAVAFWMAFSAGPSTDLPSVAANSAEVAPAASTIEPRRHVVEMPMQPERSEIGRVTPAPAQFVKARAAPKSPRTQIAQRRTPSRNNIDRSTAVPTLSGYLTEVDSSLRLAEVFDDIGSMD